MGELDFINSICVRKSAVVSECNASFETKLIFTFSIKK